MVREGGEGGRGGNCNRQYIMWIENEEGELEEIEKER